MDKAISGATVVFKFDGLEDYVFDTAKCTEQVRTMAVPFAFMHRLGDAAALSRKQKDGSVITITEQMRRDEVVRLGDYYMGGAVDWNMRGGARGVVQNPVWAALAAKRGVPYDTIAAEKAAADLAELASM